ncbi:Crp/Fnr family transcriptional regulator [Cellulophaga tyrosinoxydans]|uniref:cAMP-binding domain of CRP or a regulatory subunit of cAMP-dependent protein kinases n=1 Tax=Cellulophaga tyrosinoxydans TaxID=504486 RepID=A0A1W1YSG7_9FLAO|nr:Crp/Fnr family transcriptional regulator [Cellulophaga tyrosinoxydans]SMC39084.1 cAMP-binding domain of CRP or a regulatory subunit of cAMP-dependent protein kinases [Cellulophaga tyrosinoxydans]
MAENTLIRFLESNIPIEKSAVSAYVSTLKIRKVKKGEQLLKQGDICQHTFFVEKGLLRYFSIDKKGKENVLQFAPENWFITDRESVYFNQPSKYYIDALEDSEVLVLEKNFVEKISEQNNSFEEFNNKLLHNHIRSLQKRIELLLSATAEERYLDFIKVYPNLLLRVPQTLIASYLGITPESLSRVRKELATKHKK